MPSDTFSHTTIANAAHESIDAALQMPDTWKGIGPIDDVWDATHHGDNLAGFKWRARAAGKTWDGTATRVIDPAVNAVTFDLDSAEIVGSITVSLEPEGENTAVTVQLSARSKGLLAGMFWGVVADALRKGLPTQVEAFGKQF